MLNIKILYQDEARKKATLKIRCPHCKVAQIKDAFFADLWGRYPVKCLMCGGLAAPVYHLMAKKEVRIMWHRNDGLVKPKLGGQMYAPLSEIVPDGPF